MLWIDGWGEALRSPTLREISQELDLRWKQCCRPCSPTACTAGEFTCARPERRGLAHDRPPRRSLGLQVDRARGDHHPGRAARVGTHAAGQLPSCACPRTAFTHQGHPLGGVTATVDPTPTASRPDGFVARVGASVFASGAAPGRAHPRRTGPRRTRPRRPHVDPRVRVARRAPPRPLPHDRLRPRHPRPVDLAARPAQVVLHRARPAGLRPPRHVRLLPPRPAGVAGRGTRTCGTCCR